MISFYFQISAQIVVPFNIRHQANQKGGIVMLANVAITCNSNNNNCATYQNQMPPNGNHNQDGNINQDYVDIDNDATTFMSSSDSLNLPVCSEITWVGLYWNARISNNTLNYNIRDRVRLRLNNGAYQTLIADDLYDLTNIQGNQSFQMPGYFCFKDITSLFVNSNGRARVTVANVVSQTGNNNLFGAWTIVVVYKNQLQSMRNLTVFDGVSYVSSVNNLDIPISGFTTPQSGPVSFELGVMANEGDRNIPGDRLQFNGNGTFLDVPDALRTPNDFFNSSITYNGALTPFRQPNFNNALGFDCGIFFPNNTTQNYIGNSATSATVRVATSQDAILPRIITSAIDIYEPDLRATVRINDLNGPPAMPNDILEYTVTAKNIGSDISIQTVLRDTLDIRTDYVPNSISYLNGPFAGPKTDNIFDDQAEYIASSRVIRARVGSGATATVGGTMLNSPNGADSTTIRFRVKVVDDCIILKCDSTLENKAYLIGRGQISNNLFNNNGQSDLYNSFGCPTTASNVVSVVAPGCAALVATANSPLCVGQTLQLGINNSIYATYLWTGPNGFTSTLANPTISNVTAANAGTYTVKVTLIDGSCAYQNISVNVVVNPRPTLTLIGSTNVSCFGGNNGSLTVSSTGGNLPHTYLWSNGLQISNPQNLASGSYTVTVTNAQGCTNTGNYTITQPTAALAGTIAITSNYNGRHISCNGASDGSVQVTPSGGTAPYSYQWSNGTTTASNSGLSVGSQAVVITDSKGCTRSVSITLTQPTVISLSNTRVNVSCNGGSDGSINLTATGGTPGYTYQWSNGATTEDLSGQTAGTYAVVVTDLNGCTRSTSITLTQPAFSLQSSVIQSNVNCFGESTGALDLLITGGTPNYTYSWSNGATTQDLNNIPAGNYTVNILDSKNCPLQASFTILQPSQPLGIQLNVTNASCFGGNNGQIQSTVSGGSAPYAYIWTNSATSSSISNLFSGNYGLQVTDSKGCTLQQNATVLQPNAPLSGSITGLDPTCFGYTNGSLNVSVQGGTAPYTYSWSNGENTPNNLNVGAGIYSVLVRDAQLCELVLVDTLNQPPPMLIQGLVEPVKCFGENTGSISVSVNGGTLPYAYNWSNGETIASIQQLSAGNYTVFITDGLNCQQSQLFQVSQPSSSLSVSENHTDALCQNGQEGAIQLTVNGGTAPYTFLWNNNQTTANISQLAAGTYVATVRDFNLCSEVISVLIDDPNNTMQLSISGENINCFGEATGQATVQVSGGTAPYSYLWNNNATTHLNTGLVAGNYFVNVTDFNNCPSFISILLSQPLAPLQHLDNNNNVLCNEGSTGNISMQISGGTLPYTYLWNNGATTSNLQNIPAGNYDLLVTDSLGCNYNYSTFITEPTKIELSALVDSVVCRGEQNGTIDLTAIGGVQPYQFLWSNGATTEDIANLSANLYRVRLTDFNGCQDSLEINVFEPDSIVSIVSTQVNVSCFGGNDGSISTQALGGNGFFSYLWSNTETTSVISNLALGTYTLTVNDIKGCSEVATFNITQPQQALGLTFTSDSTSCFGFTDGKVKAFPIGGTAPYTFLWENGSTADSLENLGSGWYTVTVTDTLLCTFTDSVFVGQPDSLILALNKFDVACFGDATGTATVSISGGTPNYQISWSSGGGGLQESGLVSGWYNVAVTDANSCLAVDSIEITQPNAPLSGITNAYNNLCFGQSNGSLTVVASGGTAPYDYLWDINSTLDSISNLPNGTYSVLITDNLGCTIQLTDSIVSPLPLNSNANILPVNCFGGNDGSIQVQIFGGIPPYDFSWSNGEESDIIDSLAFGNYQLLVQDGNLCEAVFDYDIFQPTFPISLAVNQQNVSCFGGNNAQVTLNVNGGTSPYDFAWSNAQTTQNINGLSAGTYQVIVTDANNCVDSISTVISQPAEALSLSETHVDILCFGQSTGSIVLNVVGGTAPYFYNWNNAFFTQDLNNLPAGNYVVNVADNNGCSDSLLVVLTQPDSPLNIDFISNNVSCFGDSTGSLLANISGGTQPYDFSWGHSNENSLQLDSLPRAYYVLSVMDANGCTLIDSTLISQPNAPLSLNYAAIQPSCNGYNDGQLTVTILGGTPVYNYLWNNGAITATNSNLIAGSYTIVVTDSLGCKIDSTIILNQPEPVQVAFDADYLVGCSPHLVTFFNNSQPGISCVWNLGDGTVLNDCDSLQHLYENGGQYNVSLTVTDVNNCSNTATYTNFITVHQTPTADINADNLILFPAFNTLTVTNGSTGAVSYQWNLGIDNNWYGYLEPGTFNYPSNFKDTFLITLIATSEQGCRDTAYQSIIFRNDPFYYVPNTFVPDGNNVNDVWYVIFSNPSNIRSFLVRVYNRWGEIVYESKDFTEGWDGTYRGNKVQDGTYIWTMQFEWEDKRVFDDRGHVNVLR